MAYAKTGAVKSLLAGVADTLRKSVLPGAARAAAEVVAEEARTTVISAEVRDSIKVKGSGRDGRIVAKVMTAGEGAYIAPWLEYGTDPHFISIAPEDRGGRTVGRINREVKAGSLVIGGSFVGASVHHPGARPHPFMRPALDTKEADAGRAAQAYIAKRVVNGRLVAEEPGE